MAEAIDVGIRVTPPYGKSDKAGQMRLRDAAMQRLWKMDWERRAGPG
jgi:hypothetical protein